MKEEETVEGAREVAMTRARPAPARLPQSTPNGYVAYQKVEADTGGQWGVASGRAARKAEKRAASAAKRKAGIDLLTREARPQLLVTTSEAKHVIVRALVDSGAEDTVTPPGVFPGEVLPSPMSKAGLKYRAANGSPIDNLGQVMAIFSDAKGRQCGLPFQVADVERPLISVSRLAAAGHDVRFDEKGGEIHHLASGRRIPLLREKGVYVLEMHVPRLPGEPGDAGFARPVQR